MKGFFVAQQNQKELDGKKIEGMLIYLSTSLLVHRKIESICGVVVSPRNSLNSFKHFLRSFFFLEVFLLGWIELNKYRVCHDLNIWTWNLNLHVTILQHTEFIKILCNKKTMELKIWNSCLAIIIFKSQTYFGHKTGSKTVRVHRHEWFLFPNRAI